MLSKEELESKIGDIEHALKNYYREDTLSRLDLHEVLDLARYGCDVKEKGHFLCALTELKLSHSVVGNDSLDYSCGNTNCDGG